MKESDKLPKSALALYVKLYCKKKGCSSNKQKLLIEATKSWVSLSKEDKQYFRNALKEQELYLVKQFALNLQNAQPYLKRKQENIIRPPKLNTDLESAVKNETLINSIEDQAINEQNYCPVIDEIHHDNDQLENCNTTIPYESEHSVIEENNILVPEHSNVVQDNVMFIPEPTPPLRSSMELFEIVKSNEESLNNCNWAALPKSQKRRYQRALQTIKSDYIKQYTAYLEQMTPEQLFYYYKSKF